MITPFNPIAFASNLARAYEIAKCGEHTIHLITSENVDEERLTNKDLTILSEYFGIESTSDADIHIELPRPEAKDLLSAFASNTRFETKASIDARILDFQLTDFPEFDRTLGKSVENLLRVAIDKLAFDISEISKVLNVAETIAKLSGSNKYGAEHIAEAIQYQSVEIEIRRNLNPSK